MSETKELSKKVGELVVIYREQGPLASQEAYARMIVNTKDWEAKALRLAFQSAVASGAEE